MTDDFFGDPAEGILWWVELNFSEQPPDAPKHVRQSLLHWLRKELTAGARSTTAEAHFTLRTVPPILLGYSDPVAQIHSESDDWGRWVGTVDDLLVVIAAVEKSAPAAPEITLEWYTRSGGRTKTPFTSRDELDASLRSDGHTNVRAVTVGVGPEEQNITVLFGGLATGVDLSVDGEDRGWVLTTLEVMQGAIGRRARFLRHPIFGC